MSEQTTRRMFFPRDVELHPVVVGGDIQSGARNLVLDGELIVVDADGCEQTRDTVRIEVILPPGAAGRLGAQLVADQAAEIQASMENDRVLDDAPRIHLP
jgi:hypothetical protein